MNLPGTQLSLPSLSHKDKADLRFGIAQGVDYVALSFVRTAKDISATRQFLKAHGADIPIIAKIEKPEAIQNLDEIIRAADGIMVARGDLGVEMSPEQVPLLQKRIITACNCGREAGDHGHADARKHDREPPAHEGRGIGRGERDPRRHGLCHALGRDRNGQIPGPGGGGHGEDRRAGRDIPESLAPEYHISGPDESVAHAACRAAEEQHARAIVTFTQSGSTALLVSKHRPRMSIIAPTPFDQVARKMSLYWGVTPILLKSKRTTDDMIASVERAMLFIKLAKHHDLIVITAGVPIGVAGSTNMMKIHRIGEVKSLESRS